MTLSPNSWLPHTTHHPPSSTWLTPSPRLCHHIELNPRAPTFRDPPAALPPDVHSPTLTCNACVIHCLPTRLGGILSKVSGQCHLPAVNLNHQRPRHSLLHNRSNPVICVPCPSKSTLGPNHTPFCASDAPRKYRPGQCPASQSYLNANATLVARHLLYSPSLDPTRFLPTVLAVYERPPSSRPTGLAPCRLGTHPLIFILKYYISFSISRSCFHHRRDLV